MEGVNLGARAVPGLRVAERQPLQPKTSGGALRRASEPRPVPANPQPAGGRPARDHFSSALSLLLPLPVAVPVAVPVAATHLGAHGPAQRLQRTVPEIEAQQQAVEALALPAQELRGAPPPGHCGST
jgi:hypothetical protein